MFLQKVISRKKLRKFFVGVLKVNDEKSRIRSRIHLSEARLCGSGSVPKCHGSAALAAGTPALADVPRFLIVTGSVPDP
jgi:hypothetical protein